MSRIGKKLTTIPDGVTVSVDNGVLTVAGPKGTLTRVLSPLVTVIVEDGVARVDVQNKENKKERSLWGTFSAHLANMVLGVTEGFSKELEINGVGYKVALQGKDLKVEAGYSHSVDFPAPEGITFTVEKNKITVAGIDKELVGSTAADVRSIRKPEPYKGKGIKYVDEVIQRKAGKAAKA
jgi:large subunit ribosomal protein L6